MTSPIVSCGALDIGAPSELQQGGEKLGWMVSLRQGRRVGF